MINHIKFIMKTPHDKPLKQNDLPKNNSKSTIYVNIIDETSNFIKIANYRITINQTIIYHRSSHYFNNHYTTYTKQF